jgi:hypothetical protein
MSQPEENEPNQGLNKVMRIQILDAVVALILYKKMGIYKNTDSIAAKQTLFNQLICDIEVLLYDMIKENMKSSNKWNIELDKKIEEYLRTQVSTSSSP